MDYILNNYQELPSQLKEERTKEFGIINFGHQLFKGNIKNQNILSGLLQATFKNKISNVLQISSDGNLFHQLNKDQLILFKV
jgi:hypothetical protein